MNFSLRQGTTLLLLTMGLTGMTLCRMESLQLLEQPPSNEPSFVEIHKPPQEARVAIWRVKAKAAVIQQLWSGELTLFDAAARFCYLNNTPSNAPSLSWRRMEGATPNEKVCRQVLFWVDGQLAGRTPDAEVRARISQWEGALRQHLAEHGGVILPEWKPGEHDGDLPTSIGVSEERTPGQ